ncbi:MAG: hypothetical protein ACLF0G_12295 [Candidatus Brocadiia bacterium]
MGTLAAAALVALAILILVLGGLYLYARARLGNNPNLIRAGAGSVKGGLFLRLLRRYVAEDKLSEEQAGLRAAAVVCSLYGEEPREPKALRYAQEHPQDVDREVADLASEGPRVRRLITSALDYLAMLPVAAESQAAQRAVERANDLGILTPARQRLALWDFVRQAARFLNEENRALRQQKEGGAETEGPAGEKGA